MDTQLIITIAILTIAVILFTTELLRVDVVAICAMAAWSITGVLTPEESFSGFSNPATLTVAAMFIMSEALLKSGVIQIIAPYMTKLFNKSFGKAILGMSLGTGAISAFINNTPIVATFIPIVVKSAKSLKLAPGKFLIPLSYGAILGGSCTLLGTSTNLLVAGIANNYGAEKIGIFTMTPIGLIFAGAGILYLVFISKYLLPDVSKRPSLEENVEIKTFLTEVELRDLSNEKEAITIEKLFTKKDLDVTVKRLKRGNKVINNPEPETVLASADILLISGAMDKVKNVINDENLFIVNSLDNKSFPDEETQIVEVIVMSGTGLVDRKVKHINFLNRYQSEILAIRQRGRKRFSNLEDTRLRLGDVLLLQTNNNGLIQLLETEKMNNAPFMFVSQSTLKQARKRDLLKTALILLTLITLATLNILPIVTAAWAGVATLVIMNIIKMSDAYRAIDWKVIFLLAGSLSFGAAMTKSGLTKIIAENLMTLLENTGGAIVIIASLYLITMIFTELMSNNAAAALLAPLAIALAQVMELNATPLLITVMMAGSASFMTPIGYQTNTMVYSAGNYKFTDFFKVGAPLSLLLWILAAIMIPIIYPLK